MENKKKINEQDPSGYQRPDAFRWTNIEYDSEHMEVSPTSMCYFTTVHAKTEF
jgi:hypothetical protein